MPEPSVCVLMSYLPRSDIFRLFESLCSIDQQRSVFSTVYLAIDGSLSGSDLELIKSFHFENISLVVSFDGKQLGLTKRLNQLIDVALQQENFEYFARMDADDIAIEYRFLAQMSFFQDNPDVSVVGTSVIEVDSQGNKLFAKLMDIDHTTLNNKIIRKCPFNHPTVMFRREVFSKGYRYDENFLTSQDYKLWVDLAAAGYRFGNLAQPLLRFTVDDDFYSRRGWRKACGELRGKIYGMILLKRYNLFDWFFVMALFLTRISPKFIKKIAYKFGR